MRVKFLSSILAAASIALCAGIAARAQDAPARPKGPIAGPELRLPRGQFDPPPGEGEAQDAAPRTAAAQKWEYCAITRIEYELEKFGSKRTYFARVRYFRGGNESIEGGYEEEALANAMTKLGEEGWELVAIRDSFGLSEGTGSSVSSYFFKRPR